MDIYEARRRHLQALLDSAVKRGESKAQFAASIGVMPSYLPRMLSAPGTDQHKRIGEEKAAEIEDLLQMPRGSLGRDFSAEPCTKSTEEGEILEALRWLPAREREALRVELVARAELFKGYAKEIAAPVLPIDVADIKAELDALPPDQRRLAFARAMTALSDAGKAVAPDAAPPPAAAPRRTPRTRPQRARG